jgi:hypothetical protein
MTSHSSPLISSVVCHEEKFYQAILDLLLRTHDSGPWAIEELVREIGDRVAVDDALARLHGAGLVHRLQEGFVFATRAAIRATQLAA